MTRQQQLAIRRMWGRGVLELEQYSRAEGHLPNDKLFKEYREQLKADVLALAELIEPYEDTEGT